MGAGGKGAYELWEMDSLRSNSWAMSMRSKKMTETPDRIICGKKPMQSKKLGECLNIKTLGQHNDYLSKHLARDFQNHSVEMMAQRHLPSYPGASGMLFLSCGCTKRIANAKTKCLIKDDLTTSVYQSRIT